VILESSPNPNAGSYILIHRIESPTIWGNYPDAIFLMDDANAPMDAERMGVKDHSTIDIIVRALR